MPGRTPFASAAPVTEPTSGSVPGSQIEGRNDD
jgi:hypothetical protein